MSPMAEANSPPAPTRTISGGSASITARDETLRCRATSSITAPGFSSICALSSASSVLSMFLLLCRSRLALGLDHLKAFELGMAEIEAFAGLVVGPRVRPAELFGPGPRLERGLVGPDGVRGIERVVVGHGTAQQVEL